MRLRLVLALAVLACTGAQAWAQAQLVVDGSDAGEVRTDLVPGASYAPAEALAAGLGVTIAFVPGDATLTLRGFGRIVQIDVVDDPSGAARGGAVRRDGRGTGSLAAVRGEEAVWLPVKPVAEAFGATVAYLPDRAAVAVVSARSSLVDARLDGDRRGGELLRLRLDRPARMSRYRNEALGLWQLRFEGTSLARARSLEGDLLRRIDLIPDRGDLEVRIDASGAELDVQELPAPGDGYEVRIRAVAEDASASPDERRRRSVVLDPGHGGEDAGLVRDGMREARASLRLAEGVAQRLRENGFEVRLTRRDDVAAPLASRAAAGAQADLFVSLHAAELPAGEVRTWVLGDAPDAGALEAAVRRNARSALEAGVEDEIRRALLLNLVPDLEAGRRYARTVNDALFQLAGYRSGEVREGPLAVLEGSAGRGLLLEFALDDLADPGLADALAAALASALGGGAP